MSNPAKPRFSDYVFVTVSLFVILLFLFWVNASDRMGWRDLAMAAALSVLVVVVAGAIAKRKPQGYRPSAVFFMVRAFLCFLAIGSVFGAVDLDAFLLHRQDVSLDRVIRDVMLAIFFAVGVAWMTRPRVQVESLTVEAQNEEPQTVDAETGEAESKAHAASHSD